jgi:hypothetical protein
LSIASAPGFTKYHKNDGKVLPKGFLKVQSSFISTSSNHIHHPLLSSMSRPVILILGAGANIGAHVAQTFARNGYQVALAARKLSDGQSEDGYMHIKSDFSNADSIVKAFEKVTKAFGPPSVVVFNGDSYLLTDLPRAIADCHCSCCSCPEPSQ